VSAGAAAKSGRAQAPAAGMATPLKSTSSPGRADGSGTWSWSAGRLRRSDLSAILCLRFCVRVAVSRFFARVHPLRRGARDRIIPLILSRSVAMRSMLVEGERI
jgi:hypothetical protein